MYILQIQNLSVNIKNTNILHNINLNIKPGESHLIIGPNGSGKSTLSLIIIGHEKYTITHGKILYNNTNIKKITIDERIKQGLFISLQENITIPELKNKILLKYSIDAIREYNNQKNINWFTFNRHIKKYMSLLTFSKDFLERPVNKNFSGGEQKKNDILQILLLKPKCIILDEIDSGLDINTLKQITNIINNRIKNNKAILIISHNLQIINYINIHYVHILYNGHIIHTGKTNIIKYIKKYGYNYRF